MPVGKVNYKDPNGLTYKHPERSCKRCLKYPCITNMDKLYRDFAKYGCKHFDDMNVFH